MIIFGSHNRDLFKDLLLSNKEDHPSYGVFQYDIDNKVKVITSNAKDIVNHIEKSEIYYLGYVGDSNCPPQPEYYKQFYSARCDKFNANKNLSKFIFQEGLESSFNCSFWLYNKQTLEMLISTFGSDIYTDGSSFCSKYVDNWGVLESNKFWSLNYTKKRYEIRNS